MSRTAKTVLPRSRGRFAFWRNDQLVELGTGGVIIVPRGAVHRFQDVGESVGRLITVR